MSKTDSFLFIVGIVAVLAGIAAVIILIVRAPIIAMRKGDCANKELDFTENRMLQELSDSERFLFLTEYNAAKKSHVTCIVLALFLGGLGAHHFYLRRVGLGVLYLILCWTFLPAIIAIIECFFIKRRVAELNRAKAILINAKIKAIRPQSPIAL